MAAFDDATATFDDTNVAFDAEIAPSPAGTLVDLGTHPDAPSQTSELGRSLTAAIASNGKIYFGYGDSFNNTGPVNIQRYNIATALWENVLNISTERVGRFRFILDTQLWATLDDPKSSIDPCYALLEGAPAVGSALVTGPWLDNLLSANASSLETSIVDYFTPNADVTIERDTTKGSDGTASLKLTKTTSVGIMGAELVAGSRPLVEDDELHVAHAEINPSVGGNYRVDIIFYDSAGTVLADYPGVATNCPAGAFTKIYSAAPSPVGATHAGIRAGTGAGNLGVGATINIDKLSIHKWTFLDWVIGGSRSVKANWRPIHTYDVCQRVPGEICLAGAWNGAGGAGLLVSRSDDGFFPRENWEIVYYNKAWDRGDYRFYNVGVLNEKVYTVLGVSVDGGLPTEQYVEDTDEPCYIWDGTSITRGPVLDGFIKPLNFAGVLVYRSMDGRLVTFDGVATSTVLTSKCVDHYIDGGLFYVIRNDEVLRSKDLVNWHSMGVAPINATSLAVSNGVPYFGTADSKIYRLDTQILASASGLVSSSGNLNVTVVAPAASPAISASGSSLTLGSFSPAINVPGKLSATGLSVTSASLSALRKMAATGDGIALSYGGADFVIPGEDVVVPGPVGPYKSGIVVMACDMFGDPISPLNGVRVNEIVWELNAPGSAKLVANPLEPTLRHIKLNEMEIQIWIDDVLHWWGVPRSKVGDSKEVSYMCDGIMSHFLYRFIVTSLRYTSLEQFNIGLNLVNFAQTGTNMDRNIKSATFSPSGVVRSRDYKAEDKANILSLLQEFAALDRGFDFDIVIRPDGRREWKPYHPSKGTLKKNLRLEWGRNIVDYKYNEDGVEQGTRVWATGGTDANGARREQNYEDVAKSAKYGVMQRIVSEGNQLDPAWLLDRAKEEVKTNGDPIKLPELTVKNSPVQLFGEINTGDILPVLLQHGDYDINENLRVVRIRRLENGNLALTFNRVV